MRRHDDGAESDASPDNYTLDYDEDYSADPEITANAHSVEARLLDLFEGDSPNASQSSPSAAEGAGTLDLHSSGFVQKRLPIDAEHAYRCPDTHAIIPLRPPSAWPQNPLLLRPAPEANMRIRGVRYSSSKEYLRLPGTGYCAGCTLPMNNGTESEGRCLVIDFETESFIGTAMLRIKNAESALKKRPDSVPSEDTAATDKNLSLYYFHGKKRTFQAVVRGRFIKPNIPMSECITGQLFRRPPGNLPPKWILHAAVSLMSNLAPQLQVDFDSNHPRFLSPLVSTAQTVIATIIEKTHLEQEELGDHKTNCENDRPRQYCLYSGSDSSIEYHLMEPHPTSELSLHQDLLRCNKTHLPRSKNVNQSRKARKHAFDKLYSRKVKSPCFDTEKEYTFEFFQHLLAFDDFALDLGRAIGKHQLCRILNGQPLKFMAGHQLPADGTNVKNGDEHINWLWNFDIWHESLYDTAVAIDSSTEL